jgi:hypothetical protein
LNTEVGYQIRFTTGRVDSHSGASQRFDASVFKGDALFGSKIEDQRRIRFIESFSFYLREEIVETREWFGRYRRRTTCPELRPKSTLVTSQPRDANLKNIKANCAGCNIHIGVKTWRFKLDDRWDVGIIWWKLYRDFK